MFKFLSPKSPNYYLRQLRNNNNEIDHFSKESFKEKNPQDIFMRPRLVQERVLLEKLRKHADELVSPPPPPEPTPPAPKKMPSPKKQKSPVPSAKSSIVKLWVIISLESERIKFVGIIFEKSFLATGRI